MRPPEKTVLFGQNGKTTTHRKNTVARDRAIAWQDFKSNVRDRLTPDRIEAIFTEFIGSSPSSRKTTRGKSEIRFGRKGAIAVVTSGSKAGQWIDRGDDRGGEAKGDIYKAVAYWRGFKGHRAQVEYLADRLGLAPFDSKVVIDHAKIAELEAARAEAREKQRLEEEEATRQKDERRNKLRERRRYFKRITGGAGLLYLRGERKIPLAEFPPSVSFDKFRHAVAFDATNDAGELLSIQFVAVTEDGRKNKDRVWNPKEPENRRAKNTAAPLDGAVARFERQGDGPRVICEGPETALTAYAAGFDAIATLGPINFDTLPKIMARGRRNLICIDDDPKNPKRDYERRRWIQKHKAAGWDVDIMTPFAVRRFSKENNDLNDMLREEGIDAVRARIQMFATPAPVKKNYLPLDVARTKLSEITPALLSELVAWRRGSESDFAPAYATKVTAGVGKTAAVISALDSPAMSVLSAMRARGDSRGAAIFNPYHALGDDWRKRYETAEEAAAAAFDQAEDELVEAAHGTGFKVASYRGREARKPHSDELMCANIEVVREAYGRQVDIKSEICDRECPFKEGCPYLAQKKVNADIWLLSHQALFNKVPSVIGEENIAFAVIDECMEGAALLPDAEIMVRTMCDMRSGDNNRLEAMRVHLTQAIEANGLGPVKADSLIKFGFEVGAGEAAVGFEYGRKIDDGHWRSPARKANESIGPMVRVWKAVDRILTSGKSASGWLRVERDDAGNLILRVRGVKQVDKGWRVPSLHIDASLKIDLRRYWWPKIIEIPPVEVDSAPSAKVWQCTTKTFSKRSLARLKGDVSPDAAGEDSRRTRARLEVEAFINRKVRKNGGSAAVIGNLSVIEAMGLEKIPNVETGHFNAIAGKDGWGKVRSLFVVGWTLPPTVAVEGFAEAITGDVIEPLPNGEYLRGDAVRLVRGADGVYSVPCEALFHPHPVAEMLRHLICEEGLYQAVERARRVTRGPDNPGDIYVLNAAPLPIPIDGLIDADEVLYPSPEAEMLAMGGLAFEGAASAATAYPSLWLTPKAAERAMFKHREKINSPFTQIESLLGCRGDDPEIDHLGKGTPSSAKLVRVQFRRQGPKLKREQALYDPRRIDDPRAAIEALLGPIEWFGEIPAAVEAAPIQNAVPLETPDSVPLDDGWQSVIVPEPIELQDITTVPVPIQISSDGITTRTAWVHLPIEAAERPPDDDRRAWCDSVRRRGSDSGALPGDVAQRAAVERRTAA